MDHSVVLVDLSRRLKIDWSMNPHDLPASSKASVSMMPVSTSPAMAMTGAHCFNLNSAKCAEGTITRFRSKPPRSRPNSDPYYWAAFVAVGY